MKLDLGKKILAQLRSNVRDKNYSVGQCYEGLYVPFIEHYYMGLPGNACYKEKIYPAQKFFSANQSELWLQFVEI